MKVQLALLLVSLLFVGSLAFENPLQLHRNLVQRMNSLLSDVPTGPGEFPVPSPGDNSGVSPACATAMQAFGTALQSCPLGSFQGPSIGAANLTNADVAAFCTGNCITLFQNGIKAVVAACDGDLQGFDQIAELFNSVFRLTCLQVNGQYCLVTLSQSFGTFQEHHDGDFTLAELQTICSPCTALYMKAVSELTNATSSDSVNPLLDVLCVKNGDEFCYPKFQNLSHIIQNNENQGGQGGHDQGDLPFQYLCDRCVQKTISRFSGGQFDGVANQTQGLCTRDGQNRLCVELVGEAFNMVRQVCDPDQIQVGNCSDECAHSAHEMITLGGCCAGSIFLEAAHQFNVPPQLFNAAFKAACHLPVDVPAPCGPRSASVALSLRNLRYDYYLAHHSEIDPRIINDVATQAGVPPTAVTITGHSSQSTNKFATMGFSLLAAGTSITTTITSTDDVTAISQDLSSAQTSGLLSFPSLNSLPSAASVDPTASAGATADPGQTGSTSAAALVQPTAILALLIALVMFA